jgi:hypothetical protein
MTVCLVRPVFIRVKPEPKPGKFLVWPPNPSQVEWRLVWPPNPSQAKKIKDPKCKIQNAKCKIRLIAGESTSNQQLHWIQHHEFYGRKRHISKLWFGSQSTSKNLQLFSVFFQFVVCISVNFSSSFQPIGREMTAHNVYWPRTRSICALWPRPWSCTSSLVDQCDPLTFVRRMDMARMYTLMKCWYCVPMSQMELGGVCALISHWFFITCIFTSSAHSAVNWLNICQSFIEILEAVQRQKMSRQWHEINVL